MAVFELAEPGGVLAPALADLAVGPWAWAPPAIPSFDAGGAAGAAGPPESVWRVDLAGDPAASRAALAGGEHSVARTHAVLDGVPHRFDQALDQALAELARARRGQARPPVPPPESDLLAALARPGADPAHAAATIALGPAAREPDRLERTLDHIADLTRGRARIETHVGGALAARSVMALSGDTELWIAPRLSPAGARLHARSVAVAVRTRHAWARILTLILRGCGRILVLGLPAGAMTALPLVWQFVRGVLREARAWRTATAAT